MPIHPWLAERFELLRDVPSFEAAGSDPGAGARLLQYLQDPEPWGPPAGVRIEDAVADGPGGPIALKVFRPEGAAAGDDRPALLWLHGGGFVMGTIDDTESVIPGAELAARAGAVVVSVGYRLARDGVRYPAAHDDATAAWSWLAMHARGLGADAARLFAGGASVGANLATGIAVRARSGGPGAPTMPAGLLLAYPLAHFPVPEPEGGHPAELAEVPGLLRFPPEYQAGIVHNYLGRLDDLPAEVVPGNGEVAGLPEAWIAPAEYDDLRGSGDRLARQLADAGVAAHRHLARGMVHGYLGRGPSLEPVDEVLDVFAAALRGPGAR